MAIINRFQRNTINKQRWELQIIEHNDGTFELWKAHIKDSEYIKEVSEFITKEQAEKYKEKNKIYFFRTL